MRAPLPIRLVIGVALVTTLVWALVGPRPLSWPIALVVAAVAGAISFFSLRRAGELRAVEAAEPEFQDQRRGREFAYEVVATVAAVIAIGFLWDSLRSQLRSIPVVQFAPTQFRITIQPPARGAAVAVRKKALTLSVFFANGASTLRSDNGRYLGNIARALRDCGGDFKIGVSGYSSSRPFRVDNEQRNLALANARAETVAKALGPRVRGAVVPVLWPSLLSMEMENAINDRGPLAGSILSSESLARRADLVLELPGQCERSPEPAAPAAKH